MQERTLQTDGDTFIELLYYNRLDKKYIFFNNRQTKWRTMVPIV